MSKSNEELNLELIRIARELVLNEYTDLRAKVHNKWLVESDFLWRTQRLRLVYPDIPSHPNEEEIIRRAKTLMGFINTNHKEISKEPIPAVNNSVSKDTSPEPVVESTEQHVDATIEQKQETVIADEPVEEPIIDDKPDFSYDNKNINFSYPKLEDEKNISSATAKTQELNNIINPVELQKTKKDELAEISKNRLMNIMSEKHSESGATKVIPSLIRRLDEIKSNLYK